MRVRKAEQDSASLACGKDQQGRDRQTDRESNDIMTKTMATALLPSALMETGREVCSLLHSATHSRLGRSLCHLNVIMHAHLGYI